MARDCALCDCDELQPGDVNSILLDEYWPEGGSADYLGLKRHLEDEYDLPLTVRAVKKHVDEHITYSLGGVA